MHTATFYSYKGGVGRTLALMNVAHILAERGRRVFLLDFDFEAPGIDAYIDADLPEKQHKPGLLEYIESYLKEQTVAKLSDYVEELPNKCSQKHPIYAMRCGRKDDAYQTFLSKFDWKSFYKNKKGFFFIENLRSEISREFGPDYLLIDSRTGLTDISGISTIQLPNLVILLFNLNDQNLHGTARVYENIKTNAFNPSIGLCLAASPVPDLPEDARTRRLSRAEELLGKKPDVIIPFDPVVSFEEFVFCGNEFKSPLRQAYRKLADRIIRSNRLDPDTLLIMAEEFAEGGEIDQAESYFQLAIAQGSGKSHALYSYGRFLRTKGDLTGAIRIFQDAIVEDQDNAQAVVALISVAVFAGDSVLAKKSASAFIERSEDISAVRKVSVAIRAVFPEITVSGLLKVARKEISWVNCIDVAEVFAQLKRFRESAEWYREALNHCDETVGNRLVPIYNLGYALDQLGDLSSQDIFREAISLFEEQDFSKGLPTDQMNTYQAMSQAYWKVGKADMASLLIDKALELATSADPRGRVFSSVQYRRIPIAVFREECLMLKSKYGPSPAKER